MADKIIFFSKDDDIKMIAAFKKAQETFKYFWRELYWEYHRIVPGLDFAYTKIAFAENIAASEKIEHMWIGETDFNGDFISGILLNEPNELTNIKKGDKVTVPLSQLSDWLFAIMGETYGGFTIQALRSEMSPKERRDHDHAWGLNFGSFNDILIVNKQKENPENLVEHPMSKNSKEKFRDFVQQNQNELINKDKDGFSILHKETIAGNMTSIEILLQAGVDKNQKNNFGKTALDYAMQLNWEHILPILQ